MKTSICRSKGCAVPIASKRLHRDNRGRSLRMILRDHGSSADRYCTYEPYAVPIGTAICTLHLSSDCVRGYAYTVPSVLSLPLLSLEEAA